MNEEKAVSARILDSYGDLCTQFYDLSKPEPPADAFRYYLGLCRHAHGPVLEAMCGSGRFLIPLLEKSIDIRGLDASPHMLSACRETCRRRGLTPVLYQQFLQDLLLPTRYRLIIIPAASFVLLPDPQQARTAIARLRDHLEPGGRLVLEIRTPHSATDEPGQWKGRWVERPDGATIVFSAVATYNPTTKIERQVNKYELFEHGKLAATELEHWDLRYYGKDEFAAMLAKAGLTRIRMTRPYGRTPSGDKDNAIVFSCYRSG